MRLPDPRSGVRRVLAEGRLLCDTGLILLAGPLLERLEPSAADQPDHRPDQLDHRSDQAGQAAGRLARPGGGLGSTRLRVASLRVRGVGGLPHPSCRRLLEQELERRPGVRWARVNAPLGRLLVGLAEPYPRMGELVVAAERAVRVIRGEWAEREARAEREAAANQTAGDQTAGDQSAVDAGPRPRTADLPDSAAVVLRAAAALAADGIALTVASVGRVARWTPLPLEFAALVTVVDTQPRLRAVVERTIGPQRADIVLAVANAAALGLAGSSSGLGLDAVHRAHALAAARARRGAFAAAGAELLGDPDRAGAGLVAPERPRPAPAGPVERYADAAGVGLLALFGATVALTGGPRRAAAAGLAMLPRPAGLGREGFCDQLTVVLARRGAQVMNPGALRLLDRIDTVVVDSDVLVGTAFTVGEVIPLAGADASEVAVRAYALFRPTDPAATTEADGWTLAPIERLVGNGGSGNGGSGDNGPDNDGQDGDGPGRAQWRRLRAAGVHTILGLAQGTAVTAVVTAVPERAEGAEALLASCRRSGLTVRVAGGAACPDDGFGFPVIPGGHRLPAAVGDLRAAGAGVLVVSHRRPAVGGADCGVGVDGPDGAPAWGADVLVGTDLPTAAMMVEAAAVAARVSRRAVRLARIGSGAGALVALTGTGPRLLSRAMLMVNGAGALAFGDGVWAARELDRRLPPPSIPRTPWHVLSARRVLAGLGSSADGLTSAQVASRRADDVPGGTGAPGLFAALARELASPLTPVLLGGAALSAASGSVLDAGLVVSVAVMSALVGAVQQRRADRALARLFARSALRARARRDGADVELIARELVLGDVILIGPGDVVPADARLLSATSLEIDESSLTGESLPVTKSPRPVAASYVAERSSMVYEGTTVVAGSATAAVVATGPATEAGRGMAATDGPELSLLHICRCRRSG